MQYKNLDISLPNDEGRILAVQEDDEYKEEEEDDLKSNLRPRPDLNIAMGFDANIA